MTDTVVSDGLRFPQDEGINAVTDDNEPWLSAGYQGLLAGWLGGSYRYQGLTLTDYDSGAEEVDVVAGAAYIEVDAPVDVQSSLGGDSIPAYDTALPTGVLPVVAVVLPTNVADLSLGADTNNDLWLAYATDGTVGGVSAGDVYIRHGSGLSAPPHPNIKLGTVDTAGDTTSNADNQDADPTGAISGSGGTDILASPNGHIPTALLEDTESAEISVPVSDGETLTVKRWGGYKISDGTAPTGLQVQLLDGGDTVQASANTTDSRSSSGVASHTNSSGSLSIFKLRVDNATGNNYTTDGVGAVFGYEVA